MGDAFAWPTALQLRLMDSFPVVGYKQNAPAASSSARSMFPRVPQQAVTATGRPWGRRRNLPSRKVSVTSLSSGPLPQEAARNTVDTIVDSRPRTVPDCTHRGTTFSPPLTARSTYTSSTSVTLRQHIEATQAAIQQLTLRFDAQLCEIAKGHDQPTLVPCDARHGRCGDNDTDPSHSVKPPKNAANGPQQSHHSALTFPMKHGDFVDHSISVLPRQSSISLAGQSSISLARQPSISSLAGPPQTPTEVPTVACGARSTLGDLQKPDGCAPVAAIEPSALVGGVGVDASDVLMYASPSEMPPEVAEPQQAHRDLRAALRSKKEALLLAVVGLQRLVAAQRSLTSPVAPPASTQRRTTISGLSQRSGSIDLVPASRRESVISSSSRASESSPAQGAVLDDRTSPLYDGTRTSSAGMWFFSPTLPSALWGAAGRATGELLSKSRRDASLTQQPQDESLRQLLAALTERCTVMADSCRKHTETSQLLTPMVERFVAEQQRHSAATMQQRRSVVAVKSHRPSLTTSAGSPTQAPGRRESSTSNGSFLPPMVPEPAPRQQLGEILPDVAVPSYCEADYRVALAMKERALALASRLGELQRMLRIMSTESAASEDGGDPARQAIIGEFEERARALPMDEPAAGPRGIPEKTSRRSGADPELRRLESLRKVLARAHITQQQFGRNRKARAELGNLGRVRHAEVQCTIEDELLVYQQDRVAALLRKEAAVVRAFGRMQTSVANIAAYTEHIESALSCHRCWRVFSDPHIVAPCGTTVCSSCVLPVDHATGADAVAVLDCGCTAHEGLVPNDAVTGAAERWAELEHATADLVYNMKSLGLCLASCYPSRSGTLVVYTEQQQRAKQSRARLAAAAAPPRRLS